MRPLERGLGALVEFLLPKYVITIGICHRRTRHRCLPNQLQGIRGREGPTAALILHIDKIKSLYLVCYFFIYFYASGVVNSRTDGNKIIVNLQYMPTNK
jgi:hypothetical protein